MTDPLTKQERWEVSERWRARAIIEKAQKSDRNVVEELASHFVSRKLIEELTGEEHVLNKKTRRKDPNKMLPVWGKENAERQMTTQEICESLGVSYSIAIGLVKNTDYFTRISRGIYLVLDGAGNREAAKASKKKVDAPATLI